MSHLVHRDPAAYWVPVWQAAKLAGRRYATVRRWVEEGRVPVRSDGRVWLWSVFDVDAATPRRRRPLTMRDPS